MTRYSPAAAAAQWNAQNGAMQLLARTAVPVLRVRYEDAARAPETAIRDIAAFAGLAVGGTALRFLGGAGGDRWAELHAAHTASGNPMRFTTGRIPIRLDEKWRTGMPAGQRRVVTALTLPLLRTMATPGNRRDRLAAVGVILPTATGNPTASPWRRSAQDYPGELRAMCA